MDKSAPKACFCEWSGRLVRRADQPISSVNSFTNAVTLVLSFILPEPLLRDYNSVVMPI